MSRGEYVTARAISCLVTYVPRVAATPPTVSRAVHVAAAEEGRLQKGKAKPVKSGRR